MTDTFSHLLLYFHCLFAGVYTSVFRCNGMFVFSYPLVNILLLRLRLDKIQQVCLCAVFMVSVSNAGLPPPISLNKELIDLQTVIWFL